jgi:hypothetical protein
MRTLVLIVLMLLASWPPPAEADHTHDHPAPTAGALGPVTVQPGQVVVDVHGLVCAICAHGLDKRLAKLPFLDHAQLKKGVKTDIFTHTVTLAIAQGQQVDFKKLQQMIKDGGYNLVAVYLRLTGPVSEAGGRKLLQDASGQRFELGGDAAQQVVPGQPVGLQAHIEAEALKRLAEDQPVPVMVDRIEHQP